MKRRVSKLFRRTDQAVLHVVCTDTTLKTHVITATTDHPFWVVGRGWVPAQELLGGDVLKRIDSDSGAQVLRIVDTGLQADVFNFEVSFAHNYYVGIRGVLVHNESVKPTSDSVPSDFTGVFVDAKRFQPGPETPAEVIAFVERTQQHSNYDSPATLQIRAKNFLAFEKAEREISVETTKALQDPTSPHVQQGSHLAHALRGFWSDAELDIASRQRIVAEIEQRTTTGILGPNAIGELNAGDKSLLNLIVRGEQGPLSVDQLRQLPDAAYSTGVIAVHAAQVRVASAVLDAAGKYSLERRISSNRASKHFSSEQGTDLRNDLGTKIRDELGLPVMYGTAGSASDMASTMQFAVNHQGVPFSAPGLEREIGITTTADIIFDFMRISSVPHSLESQYARLWCQRGAEPNAFADPFLRFSHTYPEISQAVRMTLAGESRTDLDAVRRAARLDLARLLSYRSRP
jgi:hypothetical protein